MKQFHCKTEEHEAFGSGEVCPICFKNDETVKLIFSIMGKLSQKKYPVTREMLSARAKKGWRNRRKK